VLRVIEKIISENISEKIIAGKHREKKCRKSIKIFEPNRLV
jgi:hypothetical protein